MDKIDTSSLPWWMTALLAVILALSSVIVYLFKRSDKRDKKLDAERAAFSAEKVESAKRVASDLLTERVGWAQREAAWEAERQELRAEYATAIKSLSDNYAQALREDRQESREREDALRQEFIEVMERTDAEARRSAAETTKVLDKIYDRFLGPRGH